MNIAREDKLTLHFGALSPPLKEQLKKHKTDPSEVAQFQKDHDAIVRLAIRSVIAQSEKHRAQGRLFKRIIAHLKKRHDHERTRRD